MTDQKPIEGRVADVISDREIAINRGSIDGVLVGMRFAIIGNDGPPIYDPDDLTRPLGYAEVTKTIVKIVRLQGDHLAFARTFRTVPGTAGIFDTAVPSLTALRGTPPIPERLHVEKGETVRDKLGAAGRTVAIGDRAIQTSGDEYDEFS